MSPELTLKARVDAPRNEYHFRTADGLDSPDCFRDRDLLLLEELWDRATGRTLVPAANYGVVGTILGDSRPATMAERDARAARFARENARRNGVNARVELVGALTALADDFDTVAIAPKPYTPLAVGKQRLVDACSRLRDGGTCFLAAAPTAGLTRYEATLADCATTVERVGSRGEIECLRATVSSAFDPPTYATPERYCATVSGVDLTLFGYPGLFAAGRVDDGTRLLAETATVRDGDRVLDTCCGDGVLGAYAGLSADITLVCSDVDAVATCCARRSLVASGVAGQVVTADTLRGVDGRFDTVLCNPPTHAGDGVLSSLFGRVDDLLADDGHVFVVHHAGVDIDAALRRVGTPTVVGKKDEHVVVRVE